jgi:hypothetical protein
MRYGDLPLRIRHDTASRTPGLTARLVSDLDPFIAFSREQKYHELERLLTRISHLLKGAGTEGDSSPPLEQLAAELTAEVSRLGLDGVEPGFLAQPAMVLTSLPGAKKTIRIAMLIQNALLEYTLRLILMKGHRLVRDYSREYRIQDLFPLDSLFLVGYDLACRLVNNGLSKERIVCLDFRKDAGWAFRKTLTMPFLLQELDGIL